MTTHPAPPGAGPLAGRRVVVTRTREQAPELARRLGALGAEVVALPVIAVADPDDGGAGLASAADRLVDGAYAWVVVTSVNGASRLLAALGGRAAPVTTRWAAVGRSTAGALVAGGVDPDLVPEEAQAGRLVDAFPRPVPSGPGPARPSGTVLFARAEAARDVVGPGLRATGWSVDEVVAYRTVDGEVDPADVAAARSADAVAFTSSSTVDRAVDLLGAAGVPPVVVTIGPVTSATARRAGLVVAAEASDQSVDGLVAAVTAALAGGPARARLS